MSPNGLMIFAAGFGTRMGALTQTTPKPLLQVGGRPMIDRIVAFGRDAGLVPILANTHHLAPQMEAHLGTLGVETAFEPRILETGGGLKAAAARFVSPVIFTANADVVWDGPNPFDIVRAAWRDDLDAVLLGVDLDRALGRTTGDFTLQAGKITRGGDMVYGGVQAIRLARVLEVADTVFSLNLVWDQLIAEDRIAAVRYPGRWCDVGTPDGLDRANALVANRV